MISVFYCFFLLSLLLSTSDALVSSLNNVLRFEPIVLSEEPPIGTLVVDLASKLNINDLATSDYKFRFYSPHSLAAHYFMIDQLTGHVKTQRSLDREYLCETNACGPCQGNANCTLPIEIVAAVSNKRFGAKQQQQQQHQKFVSFGVIVEDKNEFAPQFPRPTLTLNMSENAPPNFTIPIEAATDRDSKQTTINYKIVPVSSDLTSAELDMKSMEEELNKKIRISPSSSDSTELASQLSLIIVEPFDYEEERELTFKILATDNGGGDESQSLTGTCLVTLKVIDVNDNLPVFDRQEYEYRLDESKALSGTRLIRVHATDRDDNLNSLIKYSLVDQTIITSGAGDTGKQQKLNIKSLFEIDELTGWISVAHNANLDFEQTPTYRLTVRAQDSGLSNSMPVFATVIVYLNDVNDNAPQITLNMPDDSNANPFGTDSTSNPLFRLQQLEVSEWSNPDTFLAQIILNDLDSGLNGKLRVELSQVKRRARVDQSLDDDKYEWSRTEIFSLVHLFNNIYTLVSKQPFDREQYDQYSLNITATDYGQPTPLSTTYNLLVKIKDENDNSPRFVTTESAAVDDDEPLESNQMVTYEFDVLEANAKSQTNPHEWITVGQVRAVDRDIDDNGRITYELDSFNSNDTTRFSGDLDIFKIDALTGQVKANLIKIDRETREHYTFKVIARDGCDDCPNRNKAVAKININIVDVNDNEPRLEKDIYKYTISENQKSSVNMPYLIDYIRAFDLDKANSSNAQIRYKISSVDDLNDDNGGADAESSEKVDMFDLNDYFRMDEKSGALFLIKSLDYEKCSLYEFNVIAFNSDDTEKSVDKTFSSKSLIQIQVLDSNDNAPELIDLRDETLPLVFSLDTLASSAKLENLNRLPSFKGKLRSFKLDLFKINATDADSSEFAKLSFSIEKQMKLTKSSTSESSNLEATTTVSSPLDDQYDDYNSQGSNSIYENYDDGNDDDTDIKKRFAADDLSPSKQKAQLFDCDKDNGQIYLNLKLKAVNKKKKTSQVAKRSDDFRPVSIEPNDAAEERGVVADYELDYEKNLIGIYGLVVRITDGYFISRAYVFVVLAKQFHYNATGNGTTDLVIIDDSQDYSATTTSRQATTSINCSPATLEQCQSNSSY